MELERLARGNAQGSVAVIAGQLIASQVLLSRELTARHPDPHHELERFFKPFTLALGADVAVILLVRTVEFEQRGGVFSD